MKFENFKSSKTREKWILKKIKLEKNEYRWVIKGFNFNIIISDKQKI